jgi:hypothetical protein
MRAEFYDPNDRETVVGVATWDGRVVHVSSGDDAARDRIRRVFRLTPVVVDDPALRPLSARGESVIQPGSLEWFRTAAVSRAQEAGLAARIVPEAQGQGGWDPASAYRTFRQTVAHLVGRARNEGQDLEQAGEARPDGGAESAG